MSSHYEYECSGLFNFKTQTSIFVTNKEKTKLGQSEANIIQRQIELDILDILVIITKY